MSRISQNQLRLISRRFWGGVFTLVISLAVLVQLGRQVFPLLNEYREDIGVALGETLGVVINIDELSAEWEGLRPRMELIGVKVSSKDELPIFNIQQASAELSIIDSLMNWKLTWRRLTFEDFEASIQQKENGSWQIKGLKPRKASSEGFVVDDPLDVLLLGRRVEIKDTRLNVYFKTGHETQVHLPNVSIENDTSFHRILASVGVDDDPEAISLVIEGQGDPRDSKQFVADGYLSFKNFPMEKILAAVGGSLWLESDAGQWREGHRLDLSLWFNGNAKRGVEISGQLRSDGLPLNLPEEIRIPSELNSNLMGKWHPKDGWEMTFQDVGIRWDDLEAPNIDVKVYGNKETRLALGSPLIEVGAWRDLLLQVGLDQGELGRTIKSLNPDGVLKHLDMTLTDRDSGFFDAKVQVENASIEAFMGAPAITQINGFVHFNALGGYVDLDSKDGFSLFLPKVYHDPMLFDEAKGRVRWEVYPKQKMAYLTSGLLYVKTADEEANGYFRLKLPFNKRVAEAEMTLAIGANKSVAQSHHKYVPYKIPKHLYEWLSNSIGDGAVHNIGFLYHGSVEKIQKVRPAIQLYAEMKNGRLAFDKQWPELTDINGKINLDDNELDVSVENAMLLGNTVSRTQVVLVDNPKDKGKALSIKGELESDADAAMSLLKESPVRSAIGSTFDSWEVSGDVSASIELLIPLNSNAKGMSQHVEVQFTDAKLNMTDIRLPIETINGQLNYDSETGLSAYSLAGTVWGKAIQAKVESPLIDEENEIRDTLIHFDGLVDMAQIQEWTQQPELHFAKGETRINGMVSIPAKGQHEHQVKVTINSMMEGVEFLLPQPLNKSAEEAKPFDIEITLFDGFETYDFVFDKNIRFSISGAESEFKRGDQDLAMQLVFGDQVAPFAPGYFDIFGEVPHFDMLAWNEVRKKYLDYLNVEEGDITDGRSDNERERESPPIRLALTLARCMLGDFEIKDLDVNGLGTEQEWALDLKSPLLLGKLNIHNDDRPVQMDLEYLRLPSEEEDESITEEGEQPRSGSRKDELLAEKDDLPSSVLSELDLSQAIDLDFRSSDISIGEESYGTWVFKMRTMADGVIFKDIYAKVRNMEIGDPEGGAELTWLQKDGVNTTHFNGELNATNIGDVLEAWKLEKSLESKLAYFSVESAWLGAPDQIALKNIEGIVSIDIRDGNFIRGAEAGENPFLRLMGLLNFDTFARRLMLDFSDLAKEGFAFDRTYGYMDFKNGTIYLSQPLMVESSSSKMQLAGTVDTLEEKIDAELVVTLPVTGNLAVATAFVAGLPAAVGVYIVGKLFSKQVNKVSSINYEVKGSWEAPKIKVKKIFDNKGVQEKAEEVQAQEDQSAEEMSDIPKEADEKPQETNLTDFSLHQTY